MTPKARKFRGTVDLMLLTLAIVVILTLIGTFGLLYEEMLGFPSLIRWATLLGISFIEFIFVYSFISDVFSKPKVVEVKG